MKKTIKIHSFRYSKTNKPQCLDMDIILFFILLPIWIEYQGYIAIENEYISLPPVVIHAEKMIGMDLCKTFTECTIAINSDILSIIFCVDI